MSIRKKFTRIDVSGNDDQLWKKLKEKLMDAIIAFIDSEIDPIEHTSIRDEAKEFAHLLFKYGKSKLEKSVIDNDKTMAEIEELYSKKQKNLAEARKSNAEAETIEIMNRITNLKLRLAGAKVVFSPYKDQETIVFIKQIDEFMTLLDSTFEQRKRID